MSPFEMWVWRRSDKISWKKDEEMLARVGVKKILLLSIRRRIRN